MSCIKDFLQSKTTNDIQNQIEGSFLGIFADDIANVCTNVIGYIKSDDIKGGSTACFMINTLRNPELNPQISETYHEAFKLASKKWKAAAIFYSEASIIHIKHSEPPI